MSTIVRSGPRAIIFNDTRVDRHHGCSRVMGAIEHLLERNGFRVHYRVPAHSNWLSDRRLQSLIGKTDLLLVNGEGTIHHSRKSGRILLDVAALGESLNIPAVLINALWQDNNDDFIELARRFALVSVRDTKSQQTLEKVGIASQAVPDLSLFKREQLVSQKRSGIGFSDSVNPVTSAKLHRLAKSAQGEPVPILVRERGFAGYLKFIRAGLAKGHIFDPGALMSLIGSRHFFQKNISRNPTEFLNRLASLRLHVTGRFHACTLSLIASTPFVAFPSNSHKIEALLQDAQLDPRRAKDEVFEEMLREPRGLAWSDAEMANIGQYLRYAHAAAKGLFSDIRRLA